MKKEEAVCTYYENYTSIVLTAPVFSSVLYKIRHTPFFIVHEIDVVHIISNTLIMALD